MDIEPDKREAAVFASSLVQQVNREDVANMVQVQRGMLQRFEKTNEMLINFNQLSSSRYEASVKDFQGHTQLLADMKKDLDSIFKRIRILKQRLSKAYPEAFAACSSVIMMEDEDEEEDLERASNQPSTSTTTAQPTASKPSSSSGRKPADADGSASKTRVAQPQKTKSTSRSREGGVGQAAHKAHTHRPRPEGREAAHIKSAPPRRSSPSSSQPKPKPL